MKKSQKERSVFKDKGKCPQKIKKYWNEGSPFRYVVLKVFFSYEYAEIFNSMALICENRYKCHRYNPYVS